MFAQLRMRYVLVLAMGTLLGITGTTVAMDVNFPDANLEAKLRALLGIPAPTPITDTDMQTLGWLEAGFSNISNIQGLEYATNLTAIHMYSNQISDISAVAELSNLEHLWMDQNQISDISAVAELSNLKYLWMGSNQIASISALSGLTDLTELSLGFNQISDISAVAGLTNLTTLNLQHNQISDVSALLGMTNLTKAYLSHNQIEIMNLSNSNLSSLEFLGIAYNPITSLLLADATLSQSTFDVLMDDSGIAELPGVLTLDMRGVDFTEILDLSKIYTMDDLEELLLAGATNLDGSQVVPLTVELNSLAWLDVAGLWDSFDAGTQSLLNAWDAIEGNTLVTVSIPGDANRDGTIDEDDAAILAAHWQTPSGATWQMGDFNGDGAVNDIDATLLVANWDQKTSAPVPEPNSFTLLGIGIIFLASAWRRRDTL